MDLPLNALRAFEGSARHLNFTRAAEELQLSSTAISQHVNNLEQRLDVPLFRRVRRGLTLTDERLALLPLLTEAFGRIAASIEGFRRGRGTRLREVLSVGAVGTFAVGWLLPHLCEFKREQPWVDLRIFTNNNRVDLAGEVLDFTVQFGDGHWHGTEALPLITAAFVPQRRMDRVVRRRRPHPADRAWGDPRLVARDGGGLRRKARAWRCCPPRCSRATCAAAGWCAGRDRDRRGPLLAHAPEIAPRDAGDARVPRLACHPMRQGRRRREYVVPTARVAPVCLDFAERGATTPAHRDKTEGDGACACEDPALGARTITAR